MSVSRVLVLILSSVVLSPPACPAYGQGTQKVARKIAVVDLRPGAVTLTERYVGRITAHKHIEVRAPETGRLDAVPIREGQAVERGDLLFQIIPPGSEGKPDRMVPIRAPFDGMLARLPRQQGSFVRRGEALTALVDHSRVWVYFNVPEARYLEFQSARRDRPDDDPKIELVLADGKTFDQPGKLGAIGAEFHSETGTVAFRADFPNPGGLLRHGQSATVLIRRVRDDALVIPRRATFEVLDRRFVYAVDRDGVARRREVIPQNECDEGFVVRSGFVAGDRIVVEGVGLVRDGEKVVSEDRRPKEAVAAPK